MKPTWYIIRTGQQELSAFVHDLLCFGCGQQSETKRHKRDISTRKYVGHEWLNTIQTIFNISQSLSYKSYECWTYTYINKNHDLIFFSRPPLKIPRSRFPNPHSWTFRPQNFSGSPFLREVGSCGAEWGPSASAPTISGYREAGSFTSGVNLASLTERLGLHY